MKISIEDLEAVTKRLKRAQGQIGGILRMIEDGRDYQEILTQLAAVSKALDRAGFAVISIGLRQCLVNECCATKENCGNRVDVETMEKLFLSLA